MTQPKQLAIEAIAFQDKTFFNELTQAIVAVRKQPHPVMNKDSLTGFYAHSGMQSIIKIIKAHTRITVVFGEDAIAQRGPQCRMALLNKNHPFLSSFIRHKYADSLDYDIKAALAKMGTSVASGSVDLKKNKAYGVYADVVNELAIPLWFLMPARWANAALLTPAEVAAIIVHEVGHLFTNFEFMSRTATTNNVLSGVCEVLNNPNLKIKETVFYQAAEMLKLSKEAKAALAVSTTEREVSTIFLAAAIENSRSELGYSVYDATGCEQLADQYAARCGAGMESITALDKITPYIDKQSYADNYELFGFILLGIATGGLSVVAQLFLAMLSVRKEEKYDSYKTRLLRIKEQAVQQLKDTRLKKSEIARIVADIDAMTDIISRASEGLAWSDRLAYVINSTYRKAYQYELLQKELERFAHSDLFAKSAKFSIL